MPLRSWITCLFVVLITFVFGTVYAHTGTIPDTLRLLVIAGPAVLWLGYRIREERPLPRTVLDAPLAAAAVWLIVTALFAQDRRISLEMIWPFLADILLFYLLVDLMRRGWESSFRIALGVVAVLILLISAVELGAWYFGWFGQAGWFPAGGLSNPIPPFYPRLDLALNISTVEGNLLAVLLPLVITGALVSRRKGRRVLTVLALLVLLAEFFTLSRGGMLGALVAVGVLAAFGLRSLSRPRLILTIVLLVGISAALLVGIWTAVSVRDSSDRGRVDIWNSALEMTRDHPITGVGPGGFGRALRSYRDPDLAQDKISSAHNLFLQALAETGIPGLLILLWLIVLGGRAWWLKWQPASHERRLWLEGALAAFAAYGAHSLFDTFTFTSSLLPLLILGAYIVAQPESLEEPQAARRLWLSWAAVAVFAVYAVMLIRFDVAQGWMTLSRRAIDDGDLPAALDRAEKAQSWDPWLSLYDLHDAYVLGLLANEDPSYVEKAITEYEDALAEEPTFDVGWVNLAALYRQTSGGVYATAARRALTNATDINPRNPLLWFERGNVQRALREDADLAEYAADINRTGIVDFLLDDTISPGKRLYVAVLVGSNQTIMTHKMDWYSAGQITSVTTRLVDEAQADGSWMADMAVGMYEHRLANDDDAAIRWLTRAIEQHPTDERPWIERAEIYLSRGDLDKAEADAHAALFADAYEGAYANAILAHIEEQRGASSDRIEKLLKASVRPRPAEQYFAGSVYGRPAAFDYLPQVNVSGLIPPHYYDGWFELAKRYEDQGKIGDARQVYEDLLKENPFLTNASDAIKALPADNEQQQDNP